MMPTTARSSTREKARTRSVRGGVKGVRIFDFGFLIFDSVGRWKVERCKGGKVVGPPTEDRERWSMVGGRREEGLKIFFRRILPPKPK